MAGRWRREVENQVKYRRVFLVLEFHALHQRITHVHFCLTLDQGHGVSDSPLNSRYRGGNHVLWSLQAYKKKCFDVFKEDAHCIDAPSMTGWCVCKSTDMEPVREERVCLHLVYFLKCKIVFIAEYKRPQLLFSFTADSLYNLKSLCLKIESNQSLPTLQSS